MGNLEGLFGNFGQQFGLGGGQRQPNVLPASQDPYGDPALMGGDPMGRSGGGYGYADTPLPGNVRPASEDPYGDPADGLGNQFPGLRPASEDPYGDPADQDRRWR
jgi:hypothetical protein